MDWPRRVLLLAVAGLGACGGRATAPASAPIVSAEPGDPMSAAAMMRDVRALLAPEMRGRGSYQPGARLAADYVAAELSALGLEVVRQEVRDGAENIIGIKRGGPEAILVSAHHDHLGVGPDGTVYPGADDNASGVAVFLALARARAHTPYRHTVMFVSFGAEEDGLVGSGVYVHNPAWPLARTAAVINFDMVGRNFFEAGADREATAAVIGLDEVADARPAVERAAADAGLRLVDVPARILELFDLQDRTDDWWFRRQRIPSIHFSTGLHDDYHRPQDNEGRLVPAQLERVARTAVGLLDHLATRPREVPLGGPRPEPVKPWISYDSE